MARLIAFEISIVGRDCNPFCNNVCRLGIDSNGDLRWSHIKTMLLSEGEIVSREELDACIQSLLGKNGFPEDAVVNVGRFGQAILGFDAEYTTDLDAGNK